MSRIDEQIKSIRAGILFLLNFGYFFLQTLPIDYVGINWDKIERKSLSFKSLK